MKKCTKCNRIKDESEFYADGKYLSSRCKKCKDRYSKSRKPVNRKQAKERRLDTNRNIVLKQKARYYRIKNRERQLLSRAKYRAKQIGVDFNLELSDIVIPEYCPLLGIRITVENGINNCDSSPSLDRLIPEMGYVKGNVSVISQKANRIKNNATKEELILLSKNINKYFRII